MKRFEGRNYLITGGGTGIGLAVAHKLIEGGGKVCLVGRRLEIVEKSAEDLGAGSRALRCDLADPASIRSMMEELGREWDRLDGLVNNAGVAPMAGIEESDESLWDETFAINVRGPFLLIKYALPMLRTAAKPCVVQVSSTLAERAIPGMLAYNASKAALNQLTRSLALELAPGVRVNAVMPAVVETPIHEGRGMSPEQIRGMGRMHPLRRIGQPEDVAALVAFLLSDEASWMTGAVLPIDGGLMAG